MKKINRSLNQTSIGCLINNKMKYFLQLFLFCWLIVSINGVAKNNTLDASNLADPLDVELISITHLGCDQPMGRIDINIKNGLAPYTISWSNGATTEDIEVDKEGDYKVTVSDANGEQASQTFEVKRELNDVVWTDLEGMTENAQGQLSKTTNGNGTCKSLNILPAGEDGFVELELNHTYGSYDIKFGTGNVLRNRDYKIYVQLGGGELKEMEPTVQGRKEVPSIQGRGRN